MKMTVKDFDLKSTILSGSCFRVIEEVDGSFTNILKDRVINIKDNMNVFFQVQNLNLAINAAKGIGCQIIGIYPETIMEEKQVMILGLI